MLKGIVADYSGYLVIGAGGFDASRGFRSVFRRICSDAEQTDIEDMGGFAVETELEFQGLRNLTVLGFSFQSLLRCILGCLWLRTSASMELLESIYYRDIINYVAADGAVELFRESGEQGVRLGVVKNPGHHV